MKLLRCLLVVAAFLATRLAAFDLWVEWTPSSSENDPAIAPVTYHVTLIGNGTTNTTAFTKLNRYGYQGLPPGKYIIYVEALNKDFSDSSISNVLTVDATGPPNAPTNLRIKQ